MNGNSFSEWLAATLRQRQVSPFLVALYFGLDELSHEFYRLLATPTVEECEGLAHLFGFRPADVCRRAGLMPAIY